MSSDESVVEQAVQTNSTQLLGTARVKRGMAEMLKGGVIMDVIDAEQAKIAEDAGAVAVMATARIGHFVEAQVLQSLGIDYIDESEVLAPADEVVVHSAVRLRRHQSGRSRAPAH